MNNDGYILLARAIFTQRTFDSAIPEGRKGAYIDLALMANFADRENGIKRGQVISSYRKLAKRWNWSVASVQRFLSSLEEDGLIKVDTPTDTVVDTVGGTLITIAKYDFQRFGDTPTDTVGDTPTDTHKEIKKEIKDNNPLYTSYTVPQKDDGKKPKVFQKPTVEEVRAYCQDRHNKVDAEQFVDFYESKGWKIGQNPMKDWKAAVRTWEKRKQGIGSPKQDIAPVKKTTFHNFEERHTDYDALFAEMQKTRGVV